MTEDEAAAWLAARHVPRGTLERLVSLLVEEQARQNLVARSTLATLWSRHIVDSAQLLDLSPPSWSNWLDIGSGGGFPGLVIATLRPDPVTLVEPRSLRASFLEHTARALSLANVAVLAQRVEVVSLAGAPTMISARAVASLSALFAGAAHLATADTLWLLPKGRSAGEELAAARQSWQGDFRLVPSITNPAAAIVVARNVRPRYRR